MPGNYRDDLLCLNGPETRPLFVGIPKTDQPSSVGWYYLGTYSFSLPPPPHEPVLGVKEWNSLPLNVRPVRIVVWNYELTVFLQFRSEYCEIACGRYKDDNQSVTHEMYETGARGCPIRLATCTGFDDELYQRLLDGWAQPVPRKRKSTSGSKRKSKRQATASASNEDVVMAPEVEDVVDEDVTAPESEDEYVLVDGVKAEGE